VSREIVSAIASATDRERERQKEIIRVPDRWPETEIRGWRRAPRMRAPVPSAFPGNSAFFSVACTAPSDVVKVTAQAVPLSSVLRRVLLDTSAA
jgi:hypothetical protein